MNAIEPHRVFIVDRHAYVQMALAQLIAPCPEFCVSHVASRWTAQLQADLDHRPSLVLLDWESAGMGRELLSGIREKTANAKVVGMGVWPSSRGDALAAGVDAFISKTDPPEQVLAVMRRVGQVGWRHT
jgi:DNA-binding NarL/FixJ family response regulator